MTEQSAPESSLPAPDDQYTLGKWNAKSGLALTIWLNKVNNLGTLFVNDQKFGNKNHLSNQELCRHIVNLLDADTERKLVKRYNCEDGLSYLKSVASGDVQTSQDDGGPEAFQDNLAGKPEYRVSVWATETGTALSLWSQEGYNKGTYFLDSRKFTKGDLTSDAQKASLILKHIAPEVLEELRKDWFNEVGLDYLEAFARGENPRYLRMKRRIPGEHLGDRIGSPTQKAIDAEFKTAALLESAQRRGILHYLNSLIPFPMFREFGTVDHVTVLPHSVFLINTVFSGRRIAPSSQEKAMDQYGAMAPHLEELLNEKLKPERRIFVRVALSIWSPSPFTPRSPYAIAGPELIKTLQALDGQYMKHPIDSKSVIRMIADSDTWGGPTVRKEVSTLEDNQEEDA